MQSKKAAPNAQRQQCAILFDNSGALPKDPHGCHLSCGHQGPHEFVDAHGDRYEWETDFDCDCEDCLKSDGDYCSTYWKKA